LDFARLHLRASAAAFIRKRRFMCLFHSRVACRSCCISSAAFKGYAAQGQGAPHEHTAAGEIVQFAEGIVMAQVDLRRGVLDEQRQRRIKETIDEVIEEPSDHVDEPIASTSEMAPSDAVLKSPGSPPPSETASVEIEPTNIARVDLRPKRESQKPVLCMAGRSFLDEAAAALLAQILGKHDIEAKVEPVGGGLGTGRISRLSTDGAQLVCLSYLDADLTRGSSLRVRRLQASELCAKTKADFCATRFRDALDGVGQKNVVIPFKELKVSTRDGKEWLVLNRTKDELKTMPAYDKKAETNKM
jgi:hypothetical protein